MSTLTLSPAEAKHLVKLVWKDMGVDGTNYAYNALAKRLQEAAKKPKPESKSARWTRCAADALSALEEMEEMRSGWSETFNNLTEGLQAGPFGQKCEAMDGLDLESAISAVQEAEGLEVPLGFGRD